MALFDLADVTRTLMEHIRVALVNTGHWLPGIPPPVIADLPSRTKIEGLGIYLFHVQESPHYRNHPAPGKDQPQVAYTPMGLNLYYHLCANSILEDGTAPLREQLLMGIAMKALHDTPLLGDTLPAGNKNRFKISLQPLAPNEAVQYWTAGESFVKLSAFYEVSVVFLEPEKIKSYAGRVLSYGNYIFVQGAPQITRTQNTIQYNTPLDTTPREVTIQPAQAPVGSLISFFGTGFNGNSIKLLLISSLWQEPVEVDAAMVTRVSETQIDLTIPPIAILQNSGTVVDIIPGLYSARISITEQRTLPNGTLKSFNHLSNQFPFSVMPRIDGITELAGLFTVTGFLFQHADITNEDIQVYVRETRLSLTVAGGILEGEFRITGLNTMDLKVPLGIHGLNIPLRVMVRGIESAPKWIDIP